MLQTITLSMRQKGGGEEGLLVVYMEVLQGKKDSRNLNAVSMVQWLAQVERLLCKTR